MRWYKIVEVIFFLTCKGTFDDRIAGYDDKFGPLSSLTEPAGSQKEKITNDRTLSKTVLI